MNVRLLLLVTLAFLTVSGSVSAAPPTTDPVDPVAYAPDAVTVLQLSVSQSDAISAPSAMVFTEYTFATDQIALDYFWVICSFLEADMASSPIGMAYLDLRQDANPQCGYALLKGTQATTAVVHGNRVLTIWAFGPALAGPVGDFMEIFMRASTPIVDDAILPDPNVMKAPWSADGPKVDITDYARTEPTLRN